MPKARSAPSTRSQSTERAAAARGRRRAASSEDNDSKALGALALRARPVKAADLLMRQLVDHIIENRLTEGTRLPTEAEMVAATGRARSTVREALLLLESRGVIEMRQGIAGGPVVRWPRAADLGEPLTLMLMFAGASMLDVLDARAEMESHATALAARTLTHAQLDALQASLDRQRARIENRALFLTESRVFHAIINEAGGNVVTRVLLEGLQNTLHMTTMAIEYSLSHRQTVIDDHQAILDALRARDAEGARRIAREHVTSSARYWKKVAGAQSGRPVRWSSPLPDTSAR